MDKQGSKSSIIFKMDWEGLIDLGPVGSDGWFKCQRFPERVWGILYKISL